MLSFRKKIIFVFSVIVLIGASFGSGFYLGNNYGKSKCVFCPPQQIDFSLFWEAYYKLQEKFVSPEKFDPQKIIYGAISGMVKSLNDPYTVFLTPEDSKRFLDDVKGEFEGVGLEIGIKKGFLQVIAPLEGTPAQKAGIKSGDKILKINDKETFDLTIEEAVNLIRGKKGTDVVLTIFRDGWEKSEEIKITRDVILIPSLKWELKSNNEIAYIKIYQFSEKAIFDFETAAFEILASPAKKIVLDLRDNPGGYLEVAQNIAGWFLKKDQIVVIEDFGYKNRKKEYKANGNANFLQYPINILINQGSASAAEILASSLRDNRNILLIGEKSFGKGSVQQMENLKTGSLKITIARWLTPKGEVIADKGLDPDIKVEMTEKDYEQEKDPQLDRAIEEINKIK